MTEQEIAQLIDQELTSGKITDAQAEEIFNGWQSEQTATPVEQPSYEGTEFEGVAPYEMEAIQATRQRAEAQKQEENKTLFDRAMDFMVPEQAQQFMSEWGKQATDPYGRLQERKRVANITGQKLDIPFRERMQNLMSDHLDATERSRKTKSIYDMKYLGDNAKFKMAVLLGTGASNKDIAHALKNDESLNMDVEVEDGQTYIKAPDEDEWYEIDDKAELMDFLGFGAEMATVSTLGRVFPGGSGGLRAAIMAGAGEEAILQTIQKAMGAEWNIEDVLGSAGGSLAGRLLGMGKQAVGQLLDGVGDFKKLAYGAIEGDQKARGKIKDIMTTGSEKQQSDLKNALSDMEMKADAKTGEVLGKEIDPIEGAKASTSLMDIDLLSRSFPKDKEMIDTMRKEGWASYAIPSILVDRQNRTAKRVADVMESAQFRNSQLGYLMDDVQKRLGKISDEGLGASTAGMADRITKNLRNMEKETSAKYNEMYAKMGGDFRIDTQDVIEEVQSLVDKRGAKWADEGYEFTSKPKDKKTPFESEVIDTLSPAQTVKKTTETSPLSSKITKTIEEFKKAPATFRELEHLRQSAGDMIRDASFTNKDRAIANKMYSILKEKQKQVIKKLETDGKVDSGFAEEFDKLSESVHIRKQQEEDVVSLFGKGIHKDLVAATKSALRDTGDEGQQKLLNMIGLMSKEDRNIYLPEAMLYSLGDINPETGFNKFGKLWKGIDQSPKIKAALRSAMPGKYDTLASLGKVSEAILESKANRAADGFTKGEIEDAINAKHGLVTGLINNLLVAVGGSKVFDVIQKVPGLGGTGSLALSTGILNTGKKLIQGLREDKLMAFGRAFNSPDFVELLGSNLKDTDYKKFIESASGKRIANQLRRAGDTRPLERVLRSWEREYSNNPDAPEVIEPEEDK